jgi:shikimate kinase
MVIQLYSNNIVLTGFMGSGKTTLAKMLKNSFVDFNLVDTDKEIENETGLDIASIFRDFGEEYFRNIEQKVINRLSLSSNLIIATGGGVPIFCDISQLGKNFFLLTPIEIIKERLSNIEKSNRPLFDEYVMDLYNKRFVTYYNKADYIINGSLSINHIAATISWLIKGNNNGR